MSTTLDSIKHQIQIREAKDKILKRLELQAASYGMACPAHILVDIENLKKEIEEIDESTIASVYFGEISVEQNTQKDGITGLTLHVPFQINNRSGITCTIYAEFFNEDGATYYSLNEDYQLPSGQLYVGRTFTPSYRRSKYSDFKLFVPYNAINDEYRSYSLYCYINIYDPVTERVIEESPKISFSYKFRRAGEQQYNPTSSTDETGSFVFFGLLVLFLLFVISQCSNNPTSSQVSANPTVGTEITPTPSPIPISAEQFVRDYIAMINSRQYDQAWSMLSEDFKALGRHYGNQNLESYSLYWNTIERVAIEEVRDYGGGFNEASLYLSLRYQTRDGTSFNENILVDLVKDEPRNSWLIYQIRLK